MDWGDVGQNVIVLIPIVLLIILSAFLRKRRERTPLEVVGGLLFEISQNRKLVEDFSFRWQVKKFKTGSWQRNKDKLDFLGQSLQAVLSGAFSLAEDFNRQIDMAKKHKSASYLAAIQVDKLREPLSKSKQGLEEWPQANMGNRGLLTRRRGLFG